jgi:PAS domain S-box-containing protein
MSHLPLQSHLLLSAIVDCSDDAIISKDLDGIVTSWNKAAERIFGYSEDEMVGRPITLLMPPDRIHEEANFLARLRRGERIEHYETVRVRKDGAPVEISLTVSPVKDASGQIVGASKVARDITPQKLAQRKLSQLNLELQQANRMNTEFLGVISHELRTPLNAIAGWVQILRDEKVSDHDLKSGLESIERNTWAQAKLIDDLLDMSRIMSGKLRLELDPVNLAGIINAALETVRPAAGAKGVNLTSALTSLGGLTIGDETRLQQVVWNLLSNAVKFTPKGGRVHVTLRRVNSDAEIRVVDTGRGIKPAFLPFVFDRFRQEDASANRHFGGLGLGLSIAKQLTEMHGGEVRAESKGENQGATFLIHLPVIAAHEKEGGETASIMRSAEVDLQASMTELDGIRVLVVDDEADSREVVSRILESRQATVETAGNAAQALQRFLTFSPHVVITDIGMPGEDGYELLRRLRALPGGKRVPVVALTALTRSEDRTRALRAGFQLHIPKPLHTEELLAVILNLSSLGRE